MNGDMEMSTYCMKNKKYRKPVLILTVLFCVSLTGCTKIYNGTDELTEKARKEMPVSDFETTDIQYAGMSVADNKALAWFISGNEYQAHYYLPMEVEVKGDDKYSFVRTYKPMNGETDNIAILNWNGGYSFVVNNSDCASVKITGENGIYEEKVKDKPSVGLDKVSPLSLIHI